MRFFWEPENPGFLCQNVVIDMKPVHGDQGLHTSQALTGCLSGTVGGLGSLSVCF